MRAVVVGMVLLCLVSGCTKAPENVMNYMGAVPNTIGMYFIEIRAGKFTMGSPAGEKDRGPTEEQVAVKLTKAFDLGKTEVTQGQWKQVMGTEPWKGEAELRAGKDYPATCVSWADAVEFCDLLTDLERKAGKMSTKRAYRLPTEAEWEYACRAGTTTRYSFGEDESNWELGQYAWFDGYNAKLSEKYAHAVGLKKPNPWGLHDMHGNVSEWCSDWFDRKFIGGVDPVGPGVGSQRMLRGGDWWNRPSNCRSAYRECFAPSERSASIGFRVARSQSAQ